MAAEKIISKVDIKLIENGIISPEFKDDYKKVHSKLNSHVKKTGKILTEETFEKGNEVLRKWLMELFRKGASQEKLTSYMRCGLAHLCCDFIESTYESITPEDLISRVIQSFKKRKFNKSFFKAAGIKASTPVKKKVAVKKSVKKTTPKKTTKKAPAKKAASGSKAVKKKTVKKAASKKTVQTKKTVKKTTSSTTVKKTSAPKTAEIKPATKDNKDLKKKEGLLSRLFGKKK